MPDTFSDFKGAFYPGVRLDEIWHTYFADVPRANHVVCAWGSTWKRRQDWIDQEWFAFHENQRQAGCFLPEQEASLTLATTPEKMMESRIYSGGPHAWPVGTACVLSEDGRAIYEEGIKGQEQALLEGSVFYILGVVTDYVSVEAYNDPASQDYHKPFAHPAFDTSSLEEAGFLYYTSLFTLGYGPGILGEHEVCLAPVQPLLETDEQMQQFLAQHLAPVQRVVLAAYQLYLQAGFLPRRAFEAALHDCIASGALPWQLAH